MRLIEQKTVKLIGINQQVTIKNSLSQLDCLMSKIIGEPC